jgi:hypothetical protein
VHALFPAGWRYRIAERRFSSAKIGSSSCHRLVTVLARGQLRRGGQYLHVHPGSLDQTQPSLEIFAASGAETSLSSGVGLAEVDHHVEVVAGPVVRVNVDLHDSGSRVAGQAERAPRAVGDQAVVDQPAECPA